MIIFDTITDYTISDNHYEYEEFFSYNIKLHNEIKNIKKNEEKYKKNKFLNSIMQFEKKIIQLFLESIGFDFKNDKNVVMITYVDEKYKLVNNKMEEMPSKKYKFLLQNKVSSYLYEIIKNKNKNKNYCEREKYLHLQNYYLHIINLFDDYLQINGNVFIVFFNECVNNYTIEIIFYLSTMFKKVIIINSKYIFCYQFLGLKKKYHKICKISFKDKEVLYEKIKNFFIKEQKLNEKASSYLKNNKLDEYVDLKLQINKDVLLKFLGNSNKYFELQLLTLKRIFYDSDNFVRISSNININEGKTLQYLINKYSCKHCLEIGMAFAISSYYILQTNNHTKLISIDPYQSLQWKNYGLKILKKYNLASRHKLIQKKSYEVLPILLQKFEQKFDFIFIDGFHTFDYTLLDIFYSIKLLKKNGILVIDDVLHKGVSKVISYIDTNYYHFLKKIILKNIHTICAYQVVESDNRDWNFHNKF